MKVLPSSPSACAKSARGPRSVWRLTLRRCDRQRAIEFSQTRVADARVAQRCAVDRQRFEVLERRARARKRGQRLVPASANDRAHAEIVQRARLLKAVARGRGRGDERHSAATLRVRPLAEPHPELAVEPGDVELDVARSWRQAASGFQCDQRIGRTDSG